MGMRLWFEIWGVFGTVELFGVGRDSYVSRYSESEEADTILESTTASKQRRHRIS